MLTGSHLDGTFCKSTMCESVASAPKSKDLWSGVFAKCTYVQDCGLVERHGNGRFKLNVHEFALDLVTNEVAVDEFIQCYKTPDDCPVLEIIFRKDK